MLGLGDVARVAVAAIAFAAAALSTLWLGETGDGVASLWISNALLLGIAVHRPHREIGQWLLAVLVGSVVAALAFDRPWERALLGGALNAFEVGLAWTLLVRTRLMPGALLNERSLLLMLGIVAVIAPAASGLGVALFAVPVSGVPPVQMFQYWWVSDAFGMFTLFPLLWAWQPGALRDVSRGRNPMQYLLLLAFALAITVAAVALTHHPFVIITLPLLLVALRSSTFATAAANFAVIVTVLATVALQRNGALDAAPGLDHATLDTAWIWVYACCSVMGPLLVAAVTEQRERMRTRSAELAERLGIIADSLPAYIAHLGPDLRYRYANSRYMTWLGKDPAGMIGRHPREVLGENAFQRLMPRMRAALDGQAQRFEFDMDNGQRLAVTYEPHKDARGVASGFYLLAQDVTERHRADQRVHDLLESAPDPVVAIDEGTRRITLVNAQVERVFGYPRAEVLGNTIEMFVADAHLLTRSAVGEHLEANRSGGVGHVLQLHGLRRDGSRFPCDVVLSRLHGDDAPQLIASIRDMSSQRLFEQALHEEKERAQVTLNSIGDAVVACDTELRITSMNPVAEQMTGWTRKDAIGRAFGDVVQLIEPDGGAPVLPPLVVAMREDRIVAMQVSAMLRRRDGGELAVEDSAAPIRDRNGVVIGGVMVFHDISASRAMAQRMSHLAQHDYLTGLPNRRLLHDRLSQALAQVEHGVRGALLFIDLDFFKHINDSLGHQVGDRVLQEVARRLVDVVRQDDTVSRQGGDEFVLLLVRLGDPNHAALVAGKLIAAIEEPVEVDGHALHVSASVGFALFPEDASDIKSLMKQADTALYHAKQSGRGRYSNFTAVMSERAEHRMRLEHELRAAISAHELFLVYQPKVSLPTRRVTGMEALVRWRHRDGHVVNPADFIPIAEETGLIVSIDDWVLREACRQNKAWIDAGLQALPIAVNMSLARFDAERLLGNVERALRDTGLPPDLLEIEFTESQMLGQHDRAQQLIGGIKTLGVRLAVDDFGTGYSSLSYLTHYRFDTLKIDRAFVQGLPGQVGQVAVVQAIMGMARALDSRVVGEGVETEAQADALLAMGCNEVQGFLYSQPLEAQAFAQVLVHGLPPAPLSGAP